MNRHFHHMPWPEFAELVAYETFEAAYSPGLLHQLHELHRVMGLLVSYQNQVDEMFEEMPRLVQFWRGHESAGMRTVCEGRTIRVRYTTVEKCVARRCTGTCKAACYISPCLSASNMAAFCATAGSPFGPIQKPVTSPLTLLVTAALCMPTCIHISTSEACGTLGWSTRTLKKLLG